MFLINDNILYELSDHLEILMDTISPLVAGTENRAGVSAPALFYCTCIQTDTSGKLRV
jgi:hypothetical protein